MARLGDTSATRTAKVLSLPTRSEILTLLLKSGPKTVKEIADEFNIHPNVARAHLDLMVEAGFLATETRRRTKGRPAKVYFTWESELGGMAPEGSEAEGSELEVEIRVLERLLHDATAQLETIKQLIEANKRGR